MNKMNVIIQLKKTHLKFHTEKNLAKDGEYIRFFNKIDFLEFVERVVQAAIIYPRCLEECRTCISELAFEFANNIGVGVFNLTDDDVDKLAQLVISSGEEVVSSMDNLGYYIPDSKIPRWLNDSDVYHYISDLTATSIITRVGAYAFRIEITEGEYPEINEDLIQNSLFDTVAHYGIHND